MHSTGHAHAQINSIPETTREMENTAKYIDPNYVNLIGKMAFLKQKTIGPIICNSLYVCAEFLQTWNLCIEWQEASKLFPGPAPFAYVL